MNWKKEVGTGTEGVETEREGDGNWEGRGWELGEKGVGTEREAGGNWEEREGNWEKKGLW